MRAKRDEAMMPKIEHVWQDNMQVNGTDKGNLPAKARR